MSAASSEALKDRARLDFAAARYHQAIEQAAEARVALHGLERAEREARSEFMADAQRVIGHALPDAFKGLRSISEDVWNRRATQVLAVVDALRPADVLDATRPPEGESDG